MLSHPPDVLRNAFGELVAVERPSAPPFRPRARVERAPLIVWRAVATAMLALVVITTFGVLLHTAPRPVPSVEWKAPTDFLLRMPQSDLLQTTPRFGERNVIR